MMTKTLTILAVGFVAAPMAAMQAAAIPVDDFTVISEATFINVGQSITSAVGGGVTITGTPPAVGTLLLGSSASPTLSDPGDGRGWAAGFHATPPVVLLDFDVPLAAFGASFLHIDEPEFPFGSPATIRVYDMPQGMGNLVGMVTSSGGGSDDLVDFVGIWNDSAVIRSAILSVPTGLVAVDGYGVSFVPVPEPGTLSLLGLGLAGLGFSRRRKQ